MNLKNNFLKNETLEVPASKIITDLGGKLTSSYHPEGDTYTLITSKHFSISPDYRMVDITPKDNPVFGKRKRVFYTTTNELKTILTEK